MKVYILSGASGSGKSTWAENLKRSANITKPFSVAVVSADHYFYNSKGVYRFDGNLLAEAHQACLRTFIDDCADKDYETIIVDNTNTTVAEIAPYYAIAEAFGCEVEIIRFSGRYENVHGTPPAVVKAQRARCKELVRQAPRWWSFVA